MSHTIDISDIQRLSHGVRLCFERNIDKKLGCTRAASPDYVPFSRNLSISATRTGFCRNSSNIGQTQNTSRVQDTSSSPLAKHLESGGLDRLSGRIAGCGPPPAVALLTPERATHCTRLTTAASAAEHRISQYPLLSHSISRNVPSSAARSRKWQTKSMVAACVQSTHSLIV